MVFVTTGLSLSPSIVQSVKFPVSNPPFWIIPVSHGVGLGVALGVTDGVGEAVGVGVTVAVGFGVGVGAVPTLLRMAPP